MQTKFLCFSVLRVTLGPRVKWAGCKSALTTLHPGGVILLTVQRRWSRVGLTLCCFVVYSMRRFGLRFDLCFFVLVFFSPFSIAITSLDEERANFGAFRTLVRFALVWFCLFSLPLGVWEGLWFVIAAVPGLFSYPFF